MQNKKLIYENLLNEHRNISNKIGEIKSRNFELNEEDAKEIKNLEKILIKIMDQIKLIF